MDIKAIKQYIKANSNPNSRSNSHYVYPTITQYSPNNFELECEGNYGEYLIKIDIENNNISTAIFKGPPPIPRKTETAPKIKPVRNTAKKFFNLYCFILCLLNVYINTASSIKANIEDCITLTWLLEKRDATSSNIFSPISPPIIEPHDIYKIFL